MRLIRALLFGFAFLNSVQGGARGADGALPGAIESYLSYGQINAGEGDLFTYSGKVFSEFVRADESARVTAIRELVNAYARATDLKGSLIPYSLLHRLPYGKAELAMATADHFFDENVEAARKWARLMDDRLGSESPSGYVDLRDIQNAGASFWEKESTGPFTRYLFQKSPSSALLLMASIRVPRKEEWDLVVKDRRITTHLLRLQHDQAPDRTSGVEAAEILRVLARSSNPWVRLYVAEMMIQNRVLREESLVELLANDKDELVALAVRDLQNPKKHFRHRPIRTPWTSL